MSRQDYESLLNIRIHDLIGDELRSGFYEKVVITGLDRSGKTTFINSLNREFNVYKSNKEIFINLDYLSRFKIYDRHPFIEQLIYDKIYDKNYNEDDHNLGLNRCINYFRSETGRVLFLLLLNPIYRNNRSDEDEFLTEYDNEIIENYKNLIQLLVEKCQLHRCIILDRDGIKTLNLNVEELSKMGNNDKLIEAANNYYNGRPTGISDEEYDALLAEAQKQDPGFSIFDHVKYEGVEYTAAKHPYPFEPLGKIKIYPGFNINQKLVDGDIVIPKYDGCSIRAYYNPKSGELMRIMTRSNEFTGIIQTEKLRNKVPERVPENEGILTIDFEALTPKEAYGDSCRMKSNGLINSKYQQQEVDENVRLVPFKITFEKDNPNNNLEYLDQMSKVFKRDIDFYVFKNEEIESVSKAEIELGGKTYPIDGFVIRGRQRSYIFKYYYTESRITTIRRINWNISPYGFWIPKAEFDMVRIGGSNIHQSSVGSVDTMIGGGIGVGAKVEIILSGMTIPKIVRVISKSTLATQKDQFCIPDCPLCHHELKYHTTGYYCSNEDCDLYKNRAGYVFRDHLFLSHPGMLSVSEIALNDYENLLKRIREDDNIREIFIKRIKDYSERDIIINLYLGMINLSRFSNRKVDILKSITKDHLDVDEIDTNLKKLLSNNNWLEYNIKHKYAYQLLSQVIAMYKEFNNQ